MSELLSCQAIEIQRMLAAFLRIHCACELHFFSVAGALGKKVQLVFRALLGPRLFRNNPAVCGSPLCVQHLLLPSDAVHVFRRRRLCLHRPRLAQIRCAPPEDDTLTQIGMMNYSCSTQSRRRREYRISAASQQRTERKKNRGWQIAQIKKRKDFAVP